MTLFRYKKNGLLYTITTDSHSDNHKVHPYQHNVEIGVSYRSRRRFQDFKSNMSMQDFEEVAEQ